MPSDEPEYRIPPGGGVPWRDLSMEESNRPPERDIEITDVKTMALAGNFTWGFVKVETDSGYHGIGETYRAPPGLLEFAEGLAAELVGENPLDVERLREHLDQSYTETGRIGQGAITGIEIALWDIKGKVLGVPVYELLGGKYRDSVAMYCDTHAGEALGTAETNERSDAYDPESYAHAARDVVDDGFEALKFDLDVRSSSAVDTAARRIDNDSIAHKVSLIEAVREEIGDGIDLGVDLHWNFTVETAVRLAKKLEPFDLAWIEDPVHPGKLEAQSRVAERTAQPIMTGENAVTATEFTPLVADGVLDIAAPDVTKCGGLGELRRIASLCDLYGIPVVPHNVSSPIGTMAGAHVAATIPNFVCMEYHAREVPWWSDLVRRTDTGTPILKRGSVELPESPGLGVEIDPDVADRHLVPGSELIV